MADMDFEEYRAMVEDSPVETFVVEFRDPDGELFAVALGDRLSDGLSLVYSFFAPARGASPGTLVILWHIQRARALGLDYVYLGYWIEGSPKMGYKARFQPLEVRTERGWEPANLKGEGGTGSSGETRAGRGAPFGRAVRATPRDRSRSACGPTPAS